MTVRTCSSATTVVSSRRRRRLAARVRPSRLNRIDCATASTAADPSGVVNHSASGFEVMRPRKRTLPSEVLNQDTISRAVARIVPLVRRSAVGGRRSCTRVVPSQFSAFQRQVCPRPGHRAPSRTPSPQAPSPERRAPSAERRAPIECHPAMHASKATTCWRGSGVGDRLESAAGGIARARRPWREPVVWAIVAGQWAQGFQQ